MAERGWNLKSRDERVIRKRQETALGEMNDALREAYEGIAHTLKELDEHDVVGWYRLGKRIDVIYRNKGGPPALLLMSNALGDLGCWIGAAHMVYLFCPKEAIERIAERNKDLGSILRLQHVVASIGLDDPSNWLQVATGDYVAVASNLARPLAEEVLRLRDQSLKLRAWIYCEYCEERLDRGECHFCAAPWDS